MAPSLEALCGLKVPLCGTHKFFSLSQNITQECWGQQGGGREEEGRADTKLKCHVW